MRLSVELAYAKQLYPIGTQPPAKIRLTLQQNGLDVFTEDHEAGLVKLESDVGDLPAGDYAVRIQPLAADGSLWGDPQGMSITLQPTAVEVSSPSLISASVL